ncbi:MAG: aspartate carbamoyltransferase catalytic subunit [Thermosediminibacterales bacterium]|nr:aspartate carbamoyltransferase catalytic subunit [Thermosediminibacterales bacterium]
MLKTKNLLGLRELEKDDINLILDTAESFKEILKRDIKKVPTLRGKPIVNLFFEPSTRTRTSFELAGKYLSADVVNFSKSASSVAKGETLKDTAITIQSMGVELVVIRHPMPGAPHYLAQNLAIPVINAGDGAHEHPTQALLDIFTIREKKGRIKGLKVAIIGDILHSRVARSNIWGLTKLGAEVVVAGPSTLLPPKIETLGVKAYTDIEKAVKDADVVNVLRIQLERQKKGLFPSLREYAMYFGINSRRLNQAKPDVLIMHPGPMNRGIEISSEVAESPNSTINEQVTNGVAVRMAVLYLLSGGGKIDEKGY